MHDRGEESLEEERHQGPPRGQG
ncbi:unnamed protein product [Spirodela intermedia]|uniref:Uncharacterized protein n=1 Tax=Spirodela intermedia TaxID=51605 RepID=A0A7I8K8Z7_SPIIN|nr:unnamed protein product [Spirodela intermedia]